MSTEFKQYMLRVLAQEPKPLRFFTDASNGRQTYCAGHVENWLRAWLAVGIIEGSHAELRITDAGRALLERPTTVATARVHCSVNLPNYKPRPWTPARAGADQHKRYRSLNA